MSTLPGPVVSVDWLLEHLDAVTVLDASPAGQRDEARTIAGAAWFDIDGPLSADDPLPHTMPSASQFEREVRRLGVDEGATIVVYDALGIWASPRAWWMFQAMGHDAVAVLDGGLPAWDAAGLPTSPAVDPTAGTFVARPREGFFVDQSDVLAALAAREAVVDARSRGRFDGVEPEPRPGLRSGHMPGATNVPYTDLLVDGHLRPADELAGIFRDDHAIFSCGSGMTACILALGATVAGRRGLRVYDGSWSEWGRPDGPPVVTV